MPADQLTPVELCAMALKLAEERTDGTVNALFLLVERMRPVLVEMVRTYSRLSAELADVSARQDRIESTFVELRQENDALRQANNALLDKIEGANDDARFNETRE